MITTSTRIIITILALTLFIVLPACDDSVDELTEPPLATEPLPTETTVPVQQIHDDEEAIVQLVMAGIETISQWKLEAYAELIHPDMLQDFKDMMISVYEAAQQDDPFFKFLFISWFDDKSDIESIMNMEPGEFIVDLMNGLTAQTPGFREVMAAMSTEVEIIDIVYESDELAHVVYRILLSADQYSFDSNEIAIMSAKRYGSEWKLLLQPDIQAMANSIRSTVDEDVSVDTEGPSETTSSADGQSESTPTTELSSPNKRTSEYYKPTDPQTRTIMHYSGTCTSDSNGQITTVRDHCPNYVEYFDRHGQMLGSDWERNEDDICDQEWVFDLDENGNIREFQRKDPDGSILWSSVYLYDPDGRIRISARESASGTFAYEIYHYSEDGNLLEIVRENSDETLTWAIHEYEDRSWLEKYNTPHFGPFEYKGYTHKYDENGNEIEWMECTDRGCNIKRVKEYDGDGNITRELEYDTNPFTDVTRLASITSYDQDGYAIEIVDPDPDTGSPRRVVTITYPSYDEHGNWTQRLSSIQLFGEEWEDYEPSNYTYYRVITYY